MSDSPDPSEPLYPWDEASEPARPHDPDAPRQRHDAFTEARKCAFLRVLAKTGCLLDACRRAGVASRTVYRHQDSDPRFAEHCRVAFAMAATPVELTAWQRAVEGVEQEFACGGEVHVRRRYDAGLLRLLLQGANPKKYGRNPGFTRKRLLKAERRQLRREIEAEVELKTRPRSLEQMRESILRKLSAIDAHQHEERRAGGWTQTPDGHWIPPGYAPIPGWTPPAAPGSVSPGPETPRETV